MPSPTESAVPGPAPPTPVKAPNQHKLVLLTWIGLYPMITAILWVLLPVLLPRFPLAVVTLIVTAIVVPVMGYGVMPLLLKRFGGWARR